MGVIILLALLASFVAGFMAACTILKAIASEAALTASVEGIAPSFKEEGFVTLLKHAGKQRLLRLQLFLLFRFGRRSHVETDSTGEAAIMLLEEPVVAPPEPLISLTAGLVVDCVEEEVPHTPCADCGVEECGDYTPSPSPANVGEDEGIEIFQLEAELEEECQLLAAEAWELAGKLEQLQLETTPSPEEEEEDEWAKDKAHRLTPEMAQEFEGEEDSLEQLRSEIINGKLWEAVETFHSISQEGIEVDLFEVVEDLQEFPNWDFEEVDPEALLEEYNPLGSLEEVRKRATRMFVLMTVYAYQNGNLLKTAAFFEAAYIAKYGDVERAAFADLGNLVKWPFISGQTQGILRPVWSTSLEM